MTTLAALLNRPGLDVEVTGVSADSRKVAPGDAFFALAGSKDDGLKHVADAVARGARAVIAERQPDALGDAVFVQVEDARAALSHAAS